MLQVAVEIKDSTSFGFSEDTKATVNGEDAHVELYKRSGSAYAETAVIFAVYDLRELPADPEPPAPPAEPAEPADVKNADEGVKAPATSDNNMLVLWIVLALASVAGTTYVLRRKQ